jgi:hypothetical protein
LAPDRSGRTARRAELVALITECVPDLASDLADDTPLITSGLVESLALLDVALWVEGQIDSAVDLSAFDLATEWDTTNTILDFVERHRAASPEAGTRHPQ